MDLKLDGDHFIRDSLRIVNTNDVISCICRTVAATGYVCTTDLEDDMYCLTLTIHNSKDQQVHGINDLNLRSSQVSHAFFSNERMRNDIIRTKTMGQFLSVTDRDRTRVTCMQCNSSGLRQGCSSHKCGHGTIAVL